MFSLRTPTLFFALVLLVSSNSFTQPLAYGMDPADLPIAEIEWGGAFPNAFPEEIRSVYCNGGLFVAVGDSGLILSSEDGVNWTERELSGATAYDARSNLSRVTYSGGLWIAVGRTEHSTQAQFRSENGVDWVVEVSGLSGSVTEVVFNGEEYLKIGSGGASVAEGLIVNGDSSGRLTSSNLDGSGYSLNFLDSSVRFERVKYINGYFFAIGREGKAFRSDDGVTWSLVLEIDQAFLYDIEYFKGKYYIPVNSYTAPGLQHIAVSEDGVTWEVEPLHCDTDLLGIAASENRIVIVGGNGTRIYSNNGIHWRGTRSARVVPLRFASSDEVIVGLLGHDISVYSQNGYDWRDLVFDKDRGFTDVIWFKDKFIAYDHAFDEIVTSPDGITWESQGTAPAAFKRRLNWVIAGDRLYNAADGRIYDEDLVLTTQNGIDWVAIPDVDFDEIAYGDGKYVSNRIYNDSKRLILVSNDGLNWQGAELNELVGGQAQNDIYFEIGGVTFFDGKFFGLRSGRVYSSENGTDWLKLTEEKPGNGSLSRLRTFNGEIVSIGSNGVIGSSSNGIDWSFFEIGTARPHIEECFEFKGGIYWDASWVGVFRSKFTTTIPEGLELAMGQSAGEYIATGRFRIESKLPHLPRLLESEDFEKWKPTKDVILEEEGEVQLKVSKTYQLNQDALGLRLISSLEGDIRGVWEGYSEVLNEQNCDSSEEIVSEDRAVFDLLFFSDRNIRLDKIKADGDRVVGFLEGSFNADGELSLTRTEELNCSGEISSVDFVYTGQIYYDDGGHRIEIDMIEDGCQCGILQAIRLYK